MNKRKLVILKQNPACPKCGGRMALRVPKSEQDTWRPFFGCTNYPECNGTVPVTPFSEAQASFWEKPETQEVWVWA